jgi:uncharacterized protein YkwD
VGPNGGARQEHMRAKLALALALLALSFAAAFGLAAQPTAALTNCDADPSLDNEEQAFLQLINDYREQNGLAALSPSDTLDRAAQWKSDHLAGYNYFAHDDTPINRTWVQRIRDCGYGFQTYIGENLFAGRSSAVDAFNAWKNSPGHNANMLGSSYAAIGIGRAYNAGSDYDWYWTTEFGGVADGYTSGSTPTPTSTPTPAPPPASYPCADVTGDGRVAVGDIIFVVVHFNTSHALADIDGNGRVEVTDIIAVVQQFSRVCP